MHETITAFVGLDSHAQSTAIGVAEAGRAAARFVGTVGAKFPELSKALAKLGDSAQLLIVYEAGPCGFALARQLRAGGYRCEVVAPSKVPRRPGDRVKTDRRDALTLAGLARAVGAGRPGAVWRRVYDEFQSWKQELQHHPWR